METTRTLLPAERRPLTIWALYMTATSLADAAAELQRLVRDEDETALALRLDAVHEPDDPGDYPDDPA